MNNPNKKSQASFSHQVRPKRQNIRFGINGKKSYNNLVLDAQIQEATPEALRIEIDKIINAFLEDPDKTEHIFSSDLNNLQRKYIHYKANIMNLVSKSQGREPNRELHLRKKPKKATDFTFNIDGSAHVLNILSNFEKSFIEGQELQRHTRTLKRTEKVYGRIQNNLPVVPKLASSPSIVANSRKLLPIYEKREEVLNIINQNQVIIVSSETGSGKTTQIPQYIMEDMSQKNKLCKIVCTQPRRISAIAAADRVAYERGDIVGNSVGYHIRLESKCGYNTCLIYCTVGVLLRNLMCGNDCLNNITHIIVDEIHERDKLSDFLLICIRENLRLFPQLKVILMSATVNMAKFEDYFKTAAVLSVPGRQHPIQSFFLEDVLGMTQFCTGHMTQAMKKLQKNENADNSATMEVPVNTEHIDETLEAYMNFGEDYDYTVHFDEATADLLQLFLSEDVPVDYQHSETGWTALMLASHFGDLEFVTKLCNMGAKLDLRCTEGKTPFDYARIRNKNNVFEYLEYIKEQRQKLEGSPKMKDIDYLRQLYDMTTPDEFIDYELISHVVQYIHNNTVSGSILIFLPGYDEIMQCNDNIINSIIDASSYRVFFLHSSMNMKDQRDVFKPLTNVRKIILATNIAETSITIEDVVYVIDVGKVKEKAFDSYNKLSVLQTQWISRACATQRAGRAGRVGPGFCFRLYSSQRFNHMAEERVPEILRVSLEELCLHAKIIAPTGTDIYNFLSLAPDPPSVNSVKVAIESLQALGALDKEEDLTRLGEYLAQLTLEPKLGKMLIYGSIFKCLDPVLTLAATMAYKDPFQLPAQANLKVHAMKKRKELSENILSDHVIYLLVFQKWQDVSVVGRTSDFCRDFFISEQTMRSVLETRRQLLGQLRALGFVGNSSNIDEFNTNCHSWGLVKAIMSAAFYPNVAYPTSKGVHLTTRFEKKVTVHNTSVCATKIYNYWLFYDEMIKNRGNFMIRGATVFSPMMMAIMCGTESTMMSSQQVNLDEWVTFNFNSPALLKFRNVVQAQIERALLNPWQYFKSAGNLVSQTLTQILDLQEVELGLQQPQQVGQRPKYLHCPQPSSFECNASEVGAEREWINIYKKGKSPKRYVPPPKRNVPSTARARLSFDQHQVATTSAEDVRTRFEGMSVARSISKHNRTANGIARPSESYSTYEEPSSSHTFESNTAVFAASDSHYFCNLQGYCHVGNGQNDNCPLKASRRDRNPQDLLLSALKTPEKLTDYVDDPIFLIIRAAQKRNVDIAHSSNRWVFSPQTEKAIIRFKELGKTIYLIYYVKELSIFMGVAHFNNFYVDKKSGKLTATLTWTYKATLHKSKTKHLTNPYNRGRPISDGFDGMVVRQDIGEELLRIYDEYSNSSFT